MTTIHAILRETWFFDCIEMIHLGTMFDMSWCYDPGAMILGLFRKKEQYARAAIETAGLLGGIPKILSIAMTT